ncbi:hypothetical protein R75461_08400 [Paraburkholderia nemoris]|nr:hypothetical protein R75461_08400 [Paraburkholderia nemoris]
MKRSDVLPSASGNLQVAVVAEIPADAGLGPRQGSALAPVLRSYGSFADLLADGCARLGANAGCYTCIAADLHPLASRRSLDASCTRFSSLRYTTSRLVCNGMLCVTCRRIHENNLLVPKIRP